MTYSGHVYIIYSPGMKRIKVGMSTKSPMRRISALRTASPDILMLGAIMNTSDVSFERYIHNALIRHNSHGEWFEWPQCANDLLGALRSWPGSWGIKRLSGEIGEIVKIAHKSQEDLFGDPISHTSPSHPTSTP